MAGLTYEQSKKVVIRGLWLLALVTGVEVVVSLFGKGHIIHFADGAPKAVVLIAGLLIIALSLYKAYFIIFEFMHMKYEHKALAQTVLIPTGLLTWGIIAFLWEGDYWKEARSYVLEKDIIKVEESVMPVGQPATKEMKASDIQDDHDH